MTLAVIMLQLEYFDSCLALQKPGGIIALLDEAWYDEIPVLRHCYFVYGKGNDYN